MELEELKVKVIALLLSDKRFWHDCIEDAEDTFDFYYDEDRCRNMNLNEVAIFICEEEDLFADGNFI